ncbi:hypothetical protein [Algiphilus aromaticivorans]|uniref:hypothetical protein n=1 Tax=Algiphilus aromaticivorans TaxID=382454 RepID=UPI000694DD4A|nr:hypothetical protein [Algiphilus aromaticivorans]
MKSAAPDGHRESGAQSSHTLKSTSAEPPINRVLNRCEGVRKTPSGWVALCTAHEDKRPSLAIAEGDNGMVLLHCYAGCELDSIVAGMGLEVGDLFPDRAQPLNRSQRAELRQRQRLTQLTAVLPVLQFEALVILCGAQDIAEGKALSEADRARFAAAVGRIGHAKEVLCNG